MCARAQPQVTCFIELAPIEGQVERAQAWQAVHGGQRRDVVVLHVQSIQVRQPRRRGQLRQPAENERCFGLALFVIASLCMATPQAISGDALADMSTHRHCTGPPSDQPNQWPSCPAYPKTPLLITSAGLLQAYHERCLDLLPFSHSSRSSAVGNGSGNAATRLSEATSVCSAGNAARPQSAVSRLRLTSSQRRAPQHCKPPRLDSLQTDVLLFVGPTTT